MHDLANALLEMAKPTINKLADDGIGNQMAERELDAALKAVKLAKSIYEIDLMKRKMDMPIGQAYQRDEEMENPKKVY